MKISFTALPTSGGKIQVSFDGGVSFNDYNVADIRDVGIPLNDLQKTKGHTPKSEIIGHGVDVSLYLETDADINRQIQDIEIYCEENRITEYAALIRV